MRITGEQVSIFDQDGQFGKMFPALSQATAVKISKPSSKRSQASVKTDYLFLDLRKTSGTMPDAWSVMDGVSPGGCTTLNTGEFPSVARESTLSQILQLNAPEKYYLSARACEGILRRAERRGKTLPPMLREALEEVVSLSRNEAETAGCNGCGWREGESYTLNTIDRHAVAYMQTSFANYKEGVGTLRASGGDIGGGTESIVVLNDQGGAVMNTSDIPGALRAQMKHHEPIVCMRNRETEEKTEEPG